jgi:hypothetical protein
MIESSKNHLKDSEISYFEHFKFALYACGLLFYAAIASLIHAFIPGLFKGTPAYIVIKLYKQRLVGHPNKQYQEWINDENNNSKDTQQ